MLNVLRCQLTYLRQVVTNAEARFNNSLRPRKPEGSLGRPAQDVHLDSHTAPELCCFSSSVSPFIGLVFFLFSSRFCFYGTCLSSSHFFFRGACLSSSHFFFYFACFSSSFSPFMGLVFSLLFLLSWALSFLFFFSFHVPCLSSSRFFFHGALRPQKTSGLLGTGAQDGHLDFLTAPEL